MEIETLPEVEAPTLPVPESRWQRIFYALAVTILPIGGFAVSFVAKPEWQSGESSAYFSLLLLPDVAVFFFPLLFYSSCCMLLLLIAPQRFAHRYLVRFGVYTGMLLALQYIIILASTTLSTISLTSATVLLLLNWALAKGRHNQTKTSRSVLVLLTFAGVGVVTIWFSQLFLSFPLSFLISIFACMLVAGPILCFIIMAVTSLKLFKRYEVKPAFISWVMGLIVWFGVYGLAWRFSILKAVNVYYSLPKFPPSDCYIATASARGHVQIVHAKRITTIGGEIWVTEQLRVLKCAEIALMALFPRFHGLLRRIYDRVGPFLARQMTHPFLADVAYLTLKPFEWSARLVLKALIPEIDEYIQRLYPEK